MHVKRKFTYLTMTNNMVVTFLSKVKIVLQSQVCSYSLIFISILFIVMLIAFTVNIIEYHNSFKTFLLVIHEYSFYLFVSTTTVKTVVMMFTNYLLWSLMAKVGYFHKIILPYSYEKLTCFVFFSMSKQKPFPLEHNLLFCVHYYFQKTVVVYLN